MSYYIQPQVTYFPMVDYSPLEYIATFGDKKKKKKPREKIRGSQHVKREEKQKPKKTIRIPFIRR